MSGADIAGLLARGARIGAVLKERRQTVAVGEGAAGGLVSAALLSVPGASAYFRGGAVVYTRQARRAFIRVEQEALAGMRAETEPYALLVARTVRTQLDATWGIAESGAAGPTGSSYGDAAGHVALAVSGPVERSMTHELASPDRVANMIGFAGHLLDLFAEQLG